MLYSYYSTQRPISIGTYPKWGLIEFENYDERTYIEDIGKEAWGQLIYDRKLSPEELCDYELVFGRRELELEPEQEPERER